MLQASPAFESHLLSRMAGINLRDRLPSRRVMLPGISSTRGLTIAHLLRQNTAKLILRPVTCRYLCLLPLKASQNLGIMAPKQATLGYVKSGQSTIGCVWGITSNLQDSITNQDQFYRTANSLEQRMRQLPSRQSFPSAPSLRRKQ